MDTLTFTVDQTTAEQFLKASIRVGEKLINENQQSIHLDNFRHNLSRIESDLRDLTTGSLDPVEAFKRACHSMDFFLYDAELK
jgi:hypothetical protein